MGIKPAKRRVKVWPCQHTRFNYESRWIFEDYSNASGIITLWIPDSWKCCPICKSSRPSTGKGKG